MISAGCSGRGLGFCQYPVLKPSQICRTQGICFSNYRDQIDAGAKALHDLNVKRLERVSGWPDEVQTSMDTEVNFVYPAGLLLLQHVRLMLVVEKLDNWHP